MTKKKKKVAKAKKVAPKKVTKKPVKKLPPKKKKAVKPAKKLLFGDPDPVPPSGPPS